jgi:hypothetical protein
VGSMQDAEHRDRKFHAQMAGYELDESGNTNSQKPEQAQGSFIDRFKQKVESGETQIKKENPKEFMPGVGYTTIGG